MPDEPLDEAPCTRFALTGRMSQQVPRQGLTSSTLAKASGRCCLYLGRRNARRPMVQPPAKYSD